MRKKIINIDEIANALPIDMYFSRLEFCVYTGVSDSSASGRICKLHKEGFITQHTKDGEKDGSGKDRKFYTMSADQKFLMIMRAKTPLIVLREKNRLFKLSKNRVKHADKAELMAHKVADEMKLKAAWGI